MTRPPVSVVMPFAGPEDAARAALRALGSLEVTAHDELILVDNSDRGEVARLPEAGSEPVRVVRAITERSPAHARNAGARAAAGDWILFLDADCQPRPDLLDAYFDPPPGQRVGALAGEVVPASPARGLVARYGAARSFLSQEAHMAHPYRPRAAAANLLVRRQAFLELGGFFEGLRAAEDTDFSWRLDRAGWRLELRRDAWAAHTYRSSLRKLRRQWRGYAAGRAWLARRYEGFQPRPALLQALGRGGRRSGDRASLAPRRFGDRGPPPPARLERLPFLILDGLLALEELAGFTLSNRPPADPSPPADVVLLADRFPAAGDPLVELATTLEHVRVQAIRRPDRVAAITEGALGIDYLEDDGLAARLLALGRVLARHPIRCTLDALRRRSGDPRLRELAPGVERLERDASARILSLGPAPRQSPVARMARLAGRSPGEMPPPPRLAPVRRLRVRR